MAEAVSPAAPLSSTNPASERLGFTKWDTEWLRKKLNIDLCPHAPTHMHVHIHRRKGGTDRWKNRQMDEWMEGWMDRQTDGEMIGLGVFCFSEEGSHYVTYGSWHLYPPASASWVLQSQANMVEHTSPPFTQESLGTSEKRCPREMPTYSLSGPWQEGSQPNSFPPSSPRLAALTALHPDRWERKRITKIKLEYNPTDFF